jgi:DNA-directed RNA polymerase sigma subunit (sigma70/sigma32)
VQTLAEVAEQLGLTRERVRQIQAAALKKLRALMERDDAD